MAHIVQYTKTTEAATLDMRATHSKTQARAIPLATFAAAAAASHGTGIGCAVARNETNTISAPEGSVVLVVVREAV